MSCEQEPHPGLRSYPFLGQVCRRWQTLLEAPSSQDLLWKEVCPCTLKDVPCFERDVAPVATVTGFL